MVSSRDAEIGMLELAVTVTVRIEVVGVVVVGTFVVVPGRSDGSEPWNWTNTIWATRMPVMWTSFISDYMAGVKQTAPQDWVWNRPQDPRLP